MDFSNDVIYANYPNPVTKQPGFQRPTIKIDLAPRFKEWKWFTYESKHYYYITILKVYIYINYISIIERKISIICLHKSKFIYYIILISIFLYIVTVIFIKYN